MSSLCFICENNIEDNEDFTECDSCNNLFHSKCAGITKKEVSARKNSKCLKLYCHHCFKAKNEATPEKLKEILGLLYKMDLCMQQQKTSNFHSSIEQKLSKLESKIDSNKATHTNTEEKNQHVKRNSNVAKKGSVKPTIVIKPKTKQTCTKTLDEITNKINKSDINVCETRNARDGVVVLRCMNTTETMKAKQIVNDKLGPDYDIILPKVNLPRLRICNIAQDIVKEEIINELKKHNDQIRDMDIRLITVIPRKFRSVESNDAVIEINSENYNTLLKIGLLNLPWRECRVLEHIHVKRCYKCCGFFHKSNECTLNQKCSRCSGTHKHSECKSKKVCCVNCKLSNEKFKTNIDANHHSWDKQCPIFVRKLQSIVNKIEFNPIE